MEAIDLRGLDGVMNQLARRAEMRVEALSLELVDGIKERVRESPPRTGHEYTIPGTKTPYTASAPGEPHADREGRTVNAWQALEPQREGDVVVGGIYNNHMTEGGDSVAAIMELGTEDGRIAPRPTVGPVLDDVAVKYSGQIGGA